MNTAASVQNNSDSRVRATAFHHAKNIEEKKKLQSRIADLVVDTFDLPSSPDADPGRPSLADLRLFKEALSLFQSSDLDDLIQERNIDNRCGYALCPKKNEKIQRGGEKVWNRRGGKEFRLVDKAELEKWCSRECDERAAFVRLQLSKEPAWMRQTHNENVRLLDEVRRSSSIVDALNELSLRGEGDQEMVEKLKALSLERGETQDESSGNDISIVERHSDESSSQPPNISDGNWIEGHQTRRVKFASDA